ncbi:MAG: hypothetical protein HFI86_01475 [Bacilli bacterium]|nr:hypothetical protein [Bacilli bacterium]
MDKIKIGIPRALHYYYLGNLWKNYFENINCEVIVSPPTNRDIINNGIKYANDEMCLALKIYLGHIAYLKDKCDYILVPRIDKYDVNNQTCTNFLAIYDIVNNLFNCKLLNYNIDVKNKENDFVGLVEIGQVFGLSTSQAIRAYNKALDSADKIKSKDIIINTKKLESHDLKVLLVSHPYVIYDQYFGMPIIKMLKNFNVEIIYSDKFDDKRTNSLASKISNTLYWKFSRDELGSIELVKKLVDGVIFISSFPCGPDSLANELAMRRIDLPYLNIIIDDIDALTGIETRIESFVDILNAKKQSKR